MNYRNSGKAALWFLIGMGLGTLVATFYSQHLRGFAAKARYYVTEAVRNTLSKLCECVPACREKTTNNESVANFI